MSLSNLGPGGLQSRTWRWLTERVWRLEHAFERSRAAAKPEDDTRIRIFLVMAFFSVCFVGLSVGAGWSALFSNAGRGNGYAQGLEGARGDIVDRNGKLLAVDLAHYALYVDPREVWDAKETRRALGKALPQVPAKRLDKVVFGDHRTFVLGGLTPEQKDKIFELGLPGISFEEQERRMYPLGPTAAHLVGFVDSGGKGLAGVERALDDPIRKAAGGEGAPTQLSIDIRVQAALEDELRKAAMEFTPKGAVGLVTNVHTGEILALASYPDYDANKAGEATDDQRLNRAAASVYEMGSTFKTFTVAIGLDTGETNMASTFDAREPYKLGYRTIHDFHATRKILTLIEVFQHSSNIGTAILGEKVGGERLSKYFTNLNLTKPAQVELRESARPLTPRKWDMDAVASTSFGHGINVSPLALAQAMGALLNGGKMIPLTIKKMPPGVRPEGKQVLNESTSQQMLTIMRANVTGGSGKTANVPGLSVGGKTGTGEKYDPAIRGYNHQRQVSSFAAVFPTDGAIEADRYFVLILMDEPHGTAKTHGFSTGGWVATPAVGKVIDRIAPFLGVQRKAELVTIAQPKTTIPEAGL
ncbi:penicillin-binding protein 2 [Caulobacter sp. RHG1]|uniref:peptidoglycan D,D-transpeptidase FtsI family protein n=1 Tax=Caulobacter sp. (strain RHG1) TaxID=2545762 RepID=UPI001553B746|nr:penicillin-binding protein 2 [Caulobacter sp. RHG1]NQE62584.1 Cell division protein FtsI (Peptidoglycan synthetase) [Caulobacter sp. RHG1]